MTGQCNWCDKRWPGLAIRIHCHGRGGKAVKCDCVAIFFIPGASSSYRLMPQYDSLPRVNRRLYTSIVKAMHVRHLTAHVITFLSSLATAIVVATAIADISQPILLLSCSITRSRTRHSPPVIARPVA